MIVSVSLKTPFCGQAYIWVDFLKVRFGGKSIIWVLEFIPDIVCAGRFCPLFHTFFSLRYDRAKGGRRADGHI